MMDEPAAAPGFPPSRSEPANDDESDDEIDCEEWLSLLTRAHVQVMDMEGQGLAADYGLLKRQHNRSVDLFCRFCPDLCQAAPRF